MQKRVLVCVSLVMAGMVFGGALAAAATREKIKVAVATFGDSSGRNLAVPATDYVTGTFLKLKYFTVVERSRLDQVMGELNRQMSDLVDAGTAVNLGKQMGAQLMVVGNVVSADYQVAKSACVKIDAKGNKYNSVCGTATGSASLNVRMVNVETGEIIYSAVSSRSAAESFDPAGPPPPAAGLINQALASAAQDLYGPIQKAFPLEGVVLKKEGQIIYVDLGSEWGVGKGRGVIFYKGKGKEIRHPVTGEVVGYEPEEVAKDHVAEVFPDFCKVKVGKKEAERIEVGGPVRFKPEIFY